MIVDLGMSDTEYLQYLARGEDPVKQHRDGFYVSALVKYGVSEAEAHRVAPLLDRLDCSIEEKLLVNQALRQIWNRLLACKKGLGTR